MSAIGDAREISRHRRSLTAARRAGPGKTTDSSQQALRRTVADFHVSQSAYAGSTPSPTSVSATAL